MTTEKTAVGHKYRFITAFFASTLFAQAVLFYGFGFSQSILPEKIFLYLLVSAACSLLIFSIISFVADRKIRYLAGLIVMFINITVILLAGMMNTQTLRLMCIVVSPLPVIIVFSLLSLGVMTRKNHRLLWASRLSLAIFLILIFLIPTYISAKTVRLMRAEKQSRILIQRLEPLINEIEAVYTATGDYPVDIEDLPNTFSIRIRYEQKPDRFILAFVEPCRISGIYVWLYDSADKKWHHKLLFKTGIL